MLYVIIVILLLGFFGSLGLNLHFSRRINDVNAREQGLDEIEENYQAQIMDLEDKLEATEDRIHNVYEAHRLMKIEKDKQTEDHAAVVTQYEATIDDLKKQINDERKLAATVVADRDSSFAIVSKEYDDQIRELQMREQTSQEIISSLRKNILDDGQLIKYLREQLTEAQQTALDLWIEQRRLEAVTEWEKEFKPT